MEGLYEDDIKACKCKTEWAFICASLTHVTLFHPPYDTHINMIMPSWAINHKIRLFVRKVQIFFFLLLKQQFHVGYISHSIWIQVRGLFSSKFQFWSVPVIKIYMLQAYFKLWLITLFKETKFVGCTNSCRKFNAINNHSWA